MASKAKPRSWLQRLLWLFFRPKMTPLTPPRRLSARVPADRVFPVWVARSQAEWETFPYGIRGVAANYFHDEPYGKTGALFNYDAWPSTIGEGVWGIDTVIAEAQTQDKREKRPENLWIGDFLAHEIGGHGILGVGADHNSPNTLMNSRNGAKTEADRQQLFSAIRNAYDAFDVKFGSPKVP